MKLVQVSLFLIWTFSCQLFSSKPTAVVTARRIGSIFSLGNRQINYCDPRNILRGSPENLRLPFSCPLDNGRFPKANSCRAYYQCTNGKACVELCSSMTKYDVRMQLCLPTVGSSFVSCFADERFECPARNGLFRHQHRCDRYFLCVNGRSYLRHCPYWYQFDTKQKQCMPAWYAQCARQVEIGRPKTTTTTVRPRDPRTTARNPLANRQTQAVSTETTTVTISPTTAESPLTTAAEVSTESGQATTTEDFTVASQSSSLAFQTTLAEDTSTSSPEVTPTTPDISTITEIQTASTAAQSTEMTTATDEILATTTEFQIEISSTTPDEISSMSLDETETSSETLPTGSI